MIKIETYNKETIQNFTWPENEFGQLAKRFFLPIITKGSQYYVANVHTKVEVLSIGNLVLPLTINEGECQNSHVCSPYTHYIHYGLVEIELIENRWIRQSLKTLLTLMGKLFQWSKVDKIVFVNNWMLSTILYPEISDEQLKAITDFLTEKYPEHVIAFRSINPVTTPSMIRPLSELGYDNIPSRLIYYTDTSDEQSFQSRMFKSDRNLLRKSSYKQIDNEEITTDQLRRVRELYHDLNIKKYTEWNPAFTEAFFKHVIEDHAMEVRALEHNGRIDAVFAYITVNDVTTSPIFGYDTGLPVELGLYRQISTLLLIEAKEKGTLLHQSAGGGHFKMLRRAKKTYEYMSVYTHHLSWKRRLPWKLMKLAMEYIGKPFLEKYNP